MNQKEWKDLHIHGTQMYWKDKNVGNMTKAELIQALFEITDLYDKALKKEKE